MLQIRGAVSNRPAGADMRKPKMDSNGRRPRREGTLCYGAAYYVFPKSTIKKAETRILEVERKELPKGLTYWAAVDYLSKMRREGKYNA